MIIERELYSRIKPLINSPEAIIITGMRRVGKTTLLRYIFDNIRSENKLFLDLENPLNQKYFEQKDYERILTDFSILGLDLREKGYVFLDEIQFVRNLPSVVKYLIDHYQIKFFLSGSASFYLKNFFSESLAGRKYIFELFPFSFREFLKIRAPRILLPEPEFKISSAVFDELNRYYDEYLLYGGFPQVVKKETPQEKKLALEDIFSSYFQLEVERLSDFRKTNVLRDLMLLLMERVGSKLDIQKLSKELGICRITLGEYISFLESTYFIKLIRPFSRNRDFEIRTRAKVYLCDCGLLNQFSKVSQGCLFENNVFTSLCRKGEVNYYQKKNGVEIDFILDKKYAYEVKNMASQRDFKRLGVLARELKLAGYKIVSRKFSSMEGVVYGFMV